jgi:hypothetical protein
MVGTGDRKDFGEGDRMKQSKEKWYDKTWFVTICFILFLIVTSCLMILSIYTTDYTFKTLGSLLVVIWAFWQLTKTFPW